MQSHCRLCGEHKEMDHLIDFSANETILQDFIAKFETMKITFINFKSITLPKTACDRCYEFVQECYRFYEKIKQTQIYLTSIYEYCNGNIIPADEIKKENDDNLDVEPVDSFNIFKNIDCSERETNSLTKNNEEKKYSEKQTHLKKEVKLKKHFKTRKKHANIMHTFSLNNVNIQETGLPDSTLALINKNNDSKGEISWTHNVWACMHCQAKFDSMNEVRDHSKVVHAMCFGFQCNYCKELFNYFNPFVEHIRQHEENLRLHCQFCNVKLPTPIEALSHSISHWTTSHICDLCGEILPSKSALERHKKVYKKVSLPQRCYKKKPKKVTADMSWTEYRWSCLDCSLTLPDIVSLRAHSRDVHGKCFGMKCADCLTVVANYKQFIDHVTAHRECLKNYCPYCNSKLNQTEIEDHITSTHISGLKKPCLGCGEVFPDSASLTQHKTLYDVPRVRGSSDAESLTCGVCLKVFPNGFQLRSHKVIHNEKRERDQICHSCGKAFFDVKTLTNHIRTHYTKTETCEICQRTFLTKQRLKVHISTHLELKQFACNECGKRFRRKSQLRLHLATHSAALPHRCGTCGKRFRMISYLKIHERQHTGIRPYTCEVCNETFNHWGNCNRHMIRKHGVTFAKTKITAQGKLDVNRETGETKKIDIEGNAREWCQEMLKPKKRGRKKKEGTC